MISALLVLFAVCMSVGATISIRDIVRRERALARFRADIAAAGKHTAARAAGLEVGNG